MVRLKAAKQAANIPAKMAVTDRGESLSAIEPLVLSEDSKHRGRLNDVAIDLASASAGFRRCLPPGIVVALADLVRAMNCYYSNLIEGHRTHPVDIERAMNNDYSTDPEQRNLQLEAIAHVTVQRWVDEGGVKGNVFAVESLRELHRRFCELLPDELLVVSDPDTGKKVEVVAGEFREDDVRVGRHLAVSPGAVPRFMDRFADAHSRLGRSETILAAAAAHHRFLWIHPFGDGNGRVARLMSHASLLETLDTGGVWSVARGLARSAADYRQHLMNCDAERRNDLDGRGNLSQEALAEFTDFFLRTCLDQVKFMEQLVQPDKLRNRIVVWAAEETQEGLLPGSAGELLAVILYRGELPRGEVQTALHMSERSARRVISALLDRGVLASESPRAPLTLAFPATLASRWMPGLFPEKV